jgi:hypothetical protein
MARYSYHSSPLPPGTGWHIPSYKLQQKELEKLQKLYRATQEARDNSDLAQQFRDLVQEAGWHMGQRDAVTSAGLIGRAIEVAEKLVRASR